MLLNSAFDAVTSQQLLASVTLNVVPVSVVAGVAEGSTLTRSFTSRALLHLKTPSIACLKLGLKMTYRMTL